MTAHKYSTVYNGEQWCDTHDSAFPCTVIDAPEGFDAEFTVELTERHDTPMRVEIEKIGGGTLGRRYDGTWAYAVTDLNTETVIASGQDLYTGTPKTHAQAALIVSDFVADGE
jgi:hypothetical protein